MPIALPSATYRSAAAASSSENVAPMCGTARPAASSSNSSRSLRSSSSGACVEEVEELESEHVHALQQHEVERDPRDDARRVADSDEAAAAAQRAERRLGEVAADRIDDHVAAVGEDLAERLAQIGGRDGR